MILSQTAVSSHCPSNAPKNVNHKNPHKILNRSEERFCFFTGKSLSLFLFQLPHYDCTRSAPQNLHCCLEQVKATSGKKNQEHFIVNAHTLKEGYKKQCLSILTWFKSKQKHALAINAKSINILMILGKFHIKIAFLWKVNFSVAFSSLLKNFHMPPFHLQNV